MRGIVKNVSNFLIDDDWLFIIEGTDKLKYFIMAEPFYKTNGLRTPVTKRELENLNENVQIDFTYINMMEKNIITKIKW